MSYVQEPFEDLDVMNFFLFNQLTTKLDVREGFCRRMIKSLLGIDVGVVNIHAEKVIIPDRPDKRGIRLDVQIDEVNEDMRITDIFDIEPHRDIEKHYPKKNRFQQALIDKGCLESGEKDFSKLPTLHLICITNYDPFGYDYMVYTIKNKCEEVPDLVYNDGVTIYYFNTTGSKGGSPELAAFLRYLEDSTCDNVVDEATSEVNDYVSSVKFDEVIGVNYMTLGGLMDKVANEARAEAKAEKDQIIAEKDSKIAFLESLLVKAGIDVSEPLDSINNSI